MKKFKFISFLFLMIMSLCILCSCGDNNESQGSQNGNEEHTHEWNESNKTAATCIEDGKITYKCNGCDEIKVEAITATGHTEVIDEVVEATCTSPGLTEGKRCSVCNEVLVAQEVIPAEGHEYKDESCIKCGYSIYSEGLYFELNDDGESYTVYSGNSSSDTVVIPSEYNGKPVTIIGKSAFKESYLKSITIPSSIIKIEDYAFYNSSLEHITLSEGLLSIGERAFAQCHFLRAIILPESLTTIESYAFEYGSLKSIKLNPNITSMGNCVFSYCSVIIYCEFNFALDGWSGSWDDDRLGYDDSKTVYWGVIYKKIDDVEYIVVDREAMVAAYIGKAKEVEIKSTIEIKGKVYNVTSIHSSAFSDCETLTSIKIPSSVIKIGVRSFYNCSELRTVEFMEDSKLETIENEAFRYCSKLTSFVIPKSVTSIGSKAFENCFRLVEVYNLSSLNITLGAKVVHKNIDEKSILKETSDGYLFMLYDNQYSLIAYFGEDTSLILPSDINGETYVINIAAFAHCNQLEEVVISEGVTSIGNEAFYNCYQLKSIKIPNSVKSIGNYAFGYCSNLINIEIPNSVTKISSYTFDHCTKLMEVKLPSSLIIIEKFAFSNCTELNSIVIKKNVMTVENDILKNVDNVIIYCEMEAKPEGWNSKWNSSNRPVYWGDEWQYDAGGNPVPLN